MMPGTPLLNIHTVRDPIKEDRVTAFQHLVICHSKSHNSDNLKVFDPNWRHIYEVSNTGLCTVDGTVVDVSGVFDYKWHEVLPDDICITSGFNVLRLKTLNIPNGGTVSVKPSTIERIEEAIASYKQFLTT